VLTLIPNTFSGVSNGQTLLLSLNHPTCNRLLVMGSVPLMKHLQRTAARSHTLHSAMQYTWQEHTLLETDQHMQHRHKCTLQLELCHTHSSSMSCASMSVSERSYRGLAGVMT
jgi:hypothetical protein